MSTIGSLTTFYDFIKDNNIEVPRIQRDYTYGSGTKKTNEVLNKLLEDIKNTVLDESKTLILDFVYGSENKQKMCEPLVGQQRLTTLFLIHQYAAWVCGNNEFKVTFRYSTRDNTSIFCANITDPKIFRYDSSLKSSVREQIEDCSFFRPSFYDDPSIHSMLHVLDQVETTFEDIAKDGTLFNKLTDAKCNIKFYSLNFGEYEMSDDLYIKMNARGKALTEYEIFKSQLEKYIELDLGDKELKYKFAKSFDTNYTDLVWKEMGMDMSKIDSAFISLFNNIFSIINFALRKSDKAINKDFSTSETLHFLKPTSNEIDFIINFMDVFHDIYKKHGDNDSYWCTIFTKTDNILPDNNNKIRLFKTDVNLFKTACTSNLSRAEMVKLYGMYYGYGKYELKPTEEDNNWKDAFRHIRNLVENSDNELPRERTFAKILEETEMILDGKILDIGESAYNTFQMKEEQKKAEHPHIWKDLFYYENHDILKGAISLFLVDHNSDFPIEEGGNAQILLKRLKTFSSIFNNDSKTKEKDREIRKILLSIGDFSQTKVGDFNNSKDSRMFGCMFGSWRSLLTINQFYRQGNIVKVLDTITKNGFTPQNLNMDDWRYYAYNYADLTYVSYNAPDYGYYYFADRSKPLEVRLLQSSSCYQDNIMKKMLNQILFSKINKDIRYKYFRLGEKITDEGIKLSEKDICIDAKQEGWQLTTNNSATDFIVWLKNNIPSFDEASMSVPVNNTEDYITVGLSIINGLITTYNLV